MNWYLESDLDKAERGNHHASTYLGSGATQQVLPRRQAVRRWRSGWAVERHGSGGKFAAVMSQAVSVDA